MSKKDQITEMELFEQGGLSNPCNTASWKLRSISQRMFELLTDFVPSAIQVKSKKKHLKLHNAQCTMIQNYTKEYKNMQYAYSYT